MKKTTTQNKPKLTLDRETLVTLDRNEVAKVGGGLGGEFGTTGGGGTVAGVTLTRTQWQ